MSYWNERCNYCDDDELLADWFESLMRTATWHMLTSQHSWLWMAGEKGEGAPPEVRSYEKLREAWSRAWAESSGWLSEECGFWGYVQTLKDEGVVLDEDTEWELRDWTGDVHYEDD